MNKKLSILKSLRNMISPSRPQRFYTVEEKREMALRGEPMPICVGRETRKSLRNMISLSRPQRFYTMEEKREMALRGEPMPICVERETRNGVIREYIVPIHQYIPSKAKHKKAKKMKI